MITIEVLISLIILFMVVTTSVVTIKHLYSVQVQQIRYENVYRAVINIKNYINADICQKKSFMSGEFNNFKYQARCHQEIEQRKYIKAFEPGKPEGNIGNEMAILSKVTITLKKNNFKKKFSYQKLTIRKVF